MNKYPPPPLEKPPEMSEEDWQEYQEEVKAYSKRVFRQSGGLLDVFPWKGSPPKPSH